MKKATFAAVSLLLAVPSVGMAQSTMDSMKGAVTGPDSGWYVGGAVGQSKIDCDVSAFPGASCDDSDTAYKIFGGYQINKHFAVELGYHQLGEAKATFGTSNVTFEAKTWDLVAVGILPVSQQFSVFGKLGWHKTDVDASSNVPGASGSDSNSDLTYGIGLQYDFNKNLGLRAEWQQFKKVTEDTDADVMYIGVVYRFR